MYAFPDQIKSVICACVQKQNFYGYTFILQVTKPIFKSIPENSEH